jgi:hypothetical protein
MSFFSNNDSLNKMNLDLDLNNRIHLTNKANEEHKANKTYEENKANKANKSNQANKVNEAYKYSFDYIDTNINTNNPNPNLVYENDNNKMNTIKSNSKKILYSFILNNNNNNSNNNYDNDKDNDNEIIFIALDIENYMYIWKIKPEIIKILSNIDEFDSFKKQEIFPSLIININFFIKKINKLQINQQIFINNFKYLENSNEKYIIITGNFDTIIFRKEKFLEKIKELIEVNNTKNLNNFKDLSIYYNSLLALDDNNNVINNHYHNNNDLDNDNDNDNDNDYDYNENPYEKKLKIIESEFNFNLNLNLDLNFVNDNDYDDYNNNAYIIIKDYSEILNLSSANDFYILNIFYFSYEGKEYIISLNQQNFILLFIFTFDLLIINNQNNDNNNNKNNSNNNSNSDNNKLIYIKKLPHLSSMKNKSLNFLSSKIIKIFEKKNEEEKEYKLQINKLILIIGTANGLLIFYEINFKEILFFSSNEYSINLNFNLSNFSMAKNSTFNENKNIIILRSIFSIFLNKELKNENFFIEKIDEFFFCHLKKDTEAINYIELNENENFIYIGLNNFVVKFNYELNLITQILPCFSGVNKILIFEDNLLIVMNTKNYLCFDIRGILKMKYDSCFSAIFNIEKFSIRNKKVYKINILFFVYLIINLLIYYLFIYLFFVYYLFIFFYFTF